MIMSLRIGAARGLGEESGTWEASDPARRRTSRNTGGKNPTQTELEHSGRLSKNEREKKNKKEPAGSCTCYIVESPLSRLGRHQVETGEV